MGDMSRRLLGGFPFVRTDRPDHMTITMKISLLINDTLWQDQSNPR